MFWATWKLTHFLKFKIQILKKAHLGFLGSFDMLFLVLQANYDEKISLMQLFSSVNTNAPAEQEINNFDKFCNRCIHYTVNSHSF